MVTIDEAGRGVPLGDADDQVSGRAGNLAPVRARDLQAQCVGGADVNVGYYYGGVSPRRSPPLYVGSPSPQAEIRGPWSPPSAQSKSVRDITGVDDFASGRNGANLEGACRPRKRDQPGDFGARADDESDLCA